MLAGKVIEGTPGVHKLLQAQTAAQRHTALAGLVPLICAPFLSRHSFRRLGLTDTHFEVSFGLLQECVGVSASPSQKVDMCAVLPDVKTVAASQDCSSCAVIVNFSRVTAHVVHPSMEWVLYPPSSLTAAAVRD